MATDLSKKISLQITHSPHTLTHFHIPDLPEELRNHFKISFIRSKCMGILSDAHTDVYYSSY